MHAKPLDPRRVDVASLSAAQGELAGQWPLEQLPRLADSVLGSAPEGAPVHWQAQGESRPAAGSGPEIWLHVWAQAGVRMRCQRCLAPMPFALDVDRRIRFVPGAAEAEALDAELEDDVLELERFTDLRALVEDELLLALPLVPRHDVCPEPLPMSSEPDETEAPAQAPHPFAVLANLKKPPSA